jgi:hypothetical protein
MARFRRLLWLDRFSPSLGHEDAEITPAVLNTETDLQRMGFPFGTYGDVARSDHRHDIAGVVFVTTSYPNTSRIALERQRSHEQVVGKRAKLFL